MTPLVRKMAAEHGVDLASIEGTGVGGRIRKQDVLAAAEAAKGGGAVPAAEEKAADKGAPAAKPSPLRGKTEPMSRLRKVIAKRMVESLQTSAQLTQVVEVDVTKVARLRDSIKTEFLAREGVKLSLPALLRQGHRRRAQGAPGAERDARRRGRRGDLPRPARTSPSPSTPRRAC